MKDGKIKNTTRSNFEKRDGYCNTVNKSQVFNTAILLLLFMPQRAPH